MKISMLKKGVFTGLALLLLTPALARAELLSFAQGLRIATRENRQIKIAGSDEAISGADTRIARSAMLPQVNASASEVVQSYQQKAIFAGTTIPMSQRDFYAYSLRVQQMLYDFKANASRYEAAGKVFQSRRYDAEGIRNLVGLQFANAYFDLLEADRMVLLAKEEVERLQLHLEDARNLYNAGVITKNDLLQAEVRISDAKQSLLTEQNARAIAASMVNNILARPLDTPIQAEEVNGLPPGALDTNLARSWTKAEENRPELKSVNSVLESLQLEKRSIRADYFPKLFVNGGYDYTQNRYLTHNGNWSAIFGVGINLYSGGLTRAQISKVDARKMKLLEQKDALADQIRLEVEQYILDLQSAREKVSVTKDAIEQARENVRINRAKYTEGVGTATDVLDSITLLTTAETNYYSAIYELKKAQAGVIYSEGENLSEVYK